MKRSNAPKHENKKHPLTVNLPFTEEQERLFNEYCHKYQKIKGRFVISLILQEIEKEALESVKI